MNISILTPNSKELNKDFNPGCQSELNNNPFQRKSLQRKNLKHLTLQNNITSTTSTENDISKLNSSMDTLSLNNSNSDNIENKAFENKTSFGLRRNFNHTLNIPNNKDHNHGSTITPPSLSSSPTTSLASPLFLSSNIYSSNSISTSPNIIDQKDYCSSPSSNNINNEIQNQGFSLNKDTISRNHRFSQSLTNLSDNRQNNNKNSHTHNSNKNNYNIRISNNDGKNKYNKSNSISQSSISVHTTSKELLFNQDCQYQLQDMVQLGKIGQGNSGTVVKVLHVPSSKILSKKTIPIENNNDIINDQLISELSIMKSIKSHPNIISFYGAIINHSINDELLILMEYMDCGSLDKILSVYKNFQKRKLKKVNEVSNNILHLTWFNNPLVLSRISFAVLNGLSYLYENYKIIHRDIKPSNVLINSKGYIKICDFGVSKKVINSIANTFVGTSTYMSPERIQGNVYSTKGDVWSLGLVIIELVTGEFPLGGHNDTPDGILDLLQRIVNEKSPCLPIRDYDFPPAMIDFVSRCCIKDERIRSSINDLLNHKFILKYKNQESEHEFKHWCKKIKYKIREDKQIRREIIERDKLEKKKLEKESQVVRNSRR